MTKGIYKRIIPPWNKGKKLPLLSMEHREKISKSLKGIMPKYPVSFGGRKHTPEAKEKMRLAKLGVKRGLMKKSTRLKISLALKGKIYTTDHKKKIRARVYLNIAVARNKIKKEVCKICGSKRVEAHHEDYNYPLKVEWLCKKHHKPLKHRKNVV